ncbi:uncharacterized protein [Cicer arietinum]|uniref:uncharacterized protein n=1 Tax=Cicer arietinum TaxID=3827 RepID=UPI0006414A5D
MTSGDDSDNTVATVAARQCQKIWLPLTTTVVTVKHVESNDALAERKKTGTKHRKSKEGKQRLRGKIGNKTQKNKRRKIGEETQGEKERLRGRRRSRGMGRDQEAEHERTKKYGRCSDDGVPTTTSKGSVKLSIG